MRGAIEKDMIPRSAMVTDDMQEQKFIEDNFLNLSCALFCIILSADCSAIVFLHVNFNVGFCLISKFIEDNFLNLSCALFFIILSADCSAIVFLHVNFDVGFCLISKFKHRVHELVLRFFWVHHNEKGEENWPKVQIKHSMANGRLPLQSYCSYVAQAQ